MKSIVLAVPNKGRVQGPTLELLKRIGIEARSDNERRLKVSSSKAGVKLLFARAIDIPLMVERRAADIGITGQDTVEERHSRVEQLLELGFGNCRITLAAPRKVRIPSSIATTLPYITRNFCRREGFRADIIVFSGALESVPALGIADAIVDHVETGRTLRENHLRVLRVIMESQVCIIANPDSLKQKRIDIDEIILSAQGIIAARERVILKVNAGSPEIKDALLRVIPAMKSPDVSPLAKPGSFSLLAAVPRKDVESLISRIKRLGGTDILILQPQSIIS